MTATPALTSDLQRQVLRLEDDLRARVAADPDLEGRWKQEHQRATDKDRTAASWVTWRDDRVTQAAVAWVLTSVFIRFCEDNALLKPVWITGREGRRQEALDAQLAFFREHPEDTDREWLMDAIDYLGSLPATKALVDAHSALWIVSPSGDAVTKLLEFWRRRDEDGSLTEDLADASLATRFLGDLYQDLSQHAKDTYALLQTPVFVEEFILDRTLEPALAERPLEGFKLIDPTCGSGHFLLGAFDRLLDRWHRHAPALETQARIQAALDAIHGVDLNPFAVAIARFRITVAALKASGLTSLEAAPAFMFHLAAGDSLIHGPDPDVLPGMSDRSAFMPFTYATEDGPLLLTLLEEGRYDVVVGNPPYIKVKDKSLNQIYRSKFSKVCKGTYPLTVPFMAQFFALGKRGEQAGWIGQITSNSFMKREFGTELIENFLSHQDLRIVADTSGVYVPGHGTPTVIIIGRNRQPSEGFVRAVLGVRGEPFPPANAGDGLVWTSITEHIDNPGWKDEWITVIDASRTVFGVHPWSLAGGGKSTLRATLEAAAVTRLAELIAYSIGGAVRIGSDDAFVFPATPRFAGVGPFMQQYLTGEDVRDWSANPGRIVVYPYDRNGRRRSNLELERLLWASRTLLADRSTFQGVMADAGRAWWEYMQHTASAYSTPLGINFANVATHNHFALTRGGMIFNAHAPVIKLSGSATEDEHLSLLGVLNSSAACFWLKENSQGKAGSGIGRGIQPENWMERYEFAGTTLANYPLPGVLPHDRGRTLNQIAQKLVANTPSAVMANSLPTADLLKTARNESEQIMAQGISIQEELDWEVYRLYGLIDEDLTYAWNDIPGLSLGQRAFEIVLARAVEAGELETAWFIRHKSRPITEIPVSWPIAYKEIVNRRMEIMAINPSIRLLENPDYKRRWATEPWEKRQERALRDWLLDRLEDRRIWFDAQSRPLPRSVAQLADDVSRDPKMMSILALWEGRPDVPVTQTLARILTDEAVPFLNAYRYKESGRRKREAWERTWALQRREDAGDSVGRIEVPPKYTSADFRKNSYWQARGKLDVPKERFILYPNAGRETDPTPLLGWAGWDHAQQSLALSLIIGEREKDGWDDNRLVPLVAGLAELQPWVEQWHGEVDPSYGVSLAAFCREQLTSRAAQVGKTLKELADWRPEPPKHGRRARRSE